MTSARKPKPGRRTVGAAMPSIAGLVLDGPFAETKDLALVVPHDADAEERTVRHPRPRNADARGEAETRRR